jgi:thioredoxin reductase (NADPH)
MYDICIIGGGPAGITAALYSARAGRTTALLEEKIIGGQMAETSVIENMPGSPDAEGWELAMRFAQQVSKMSVDMVYEKAAKLENQENSVKITTQSGKTLEAKKVILAMGVRRRHLNVPGEDRLTGRGVGWCAVCDGAFFRNQPVAVVGGGNTALEDALYLSGICQTVYLLVRGDSFRGQETLQQRVRQRENIQVLFGTQVREICGEEKVSGVTIAHQGQEKQLTVSGVFVAIGLSPEPELYQELVETTPEGYILAAEDCRTTSPNILVAGDLRKKEIRQIVTALGDGAVAAEMAGRDLQ